MDDLFTILVIFFLFVAPVLEKILKSGRKGQPPQQQQQRQRSRPEPARRQQLPDGRTTTVSRPQESEAGGARDLLPADLWQILTGQQRQPERVEERPAPAPPPAPPPVRQKRVTVAERRVAAERKRAERLAREAAVKASRRGLSREDAEAAELMRRRERDQETRRAYDHSAPQIVSLETEPAAEPVRHAAFHDRLDRLPPPAARRRQASTTFDLDLNDPDALKQAILLQEVLGRPKGLD